MGILDRFKTQPKWKASDPAVRAAGVQEIPEDEQDLLAAIVREDDDPRVRRAAVSKLGTVAVLADTLGRDADEGVRDEAAGVLLDIALGAYEADEAASLAALDALGALPAAAAQKHFVLVAKTAQRESICRAALGRLGGDQKALGTVCRRAEIEAVRMAALEALTDPAELVATALRSNFRDVALGAVERIASDQAALKSVATRAANPAAARKARALLRALEDEQKAAAERETSRQHARDMKRRALKDLVREVNDLAASASSPGAESRLGALQARWAAEATDAEASVSDQFSTAVAAANDSLARAAAARAEEERAAEAVESILGVRRVLISRVESLDVDTPPEALAAVVEEWKGLDPLDHPAVRELAGRFDAAVKGLERRKRDRAAQADRGRRLTDLATALEALVADEKYPGARELRQRARRLRQDWAAALPALADDPSAADAVARGQAADAALGSRDQAWRDARVAESDEQRRRAQQALQRLIDLGKAETPTLKSLDRAISEGISAETALEAEHGDAARDELLAKLQAARTELQPKAQALREADDWQRWANAGVQERLIGEMEKLATATDPMASLRRMRELSVEWKAVASAPRDRAEALWNRFRAASEAVRAHFEPLRAQRATEQAEHLTRKVALCERAEALRESTDWIATADALKALQAEWKTVGPAPRRDEQAVWERFRAACNAFFTRRQDDLKRRKDEWTINLEKKEALILRAEALVESTDSDKAFVELKGLQAEWKAIGPVRKSKSEQVWQRFRTAADKVFDRYRNRDAQALADRVSRRETICTEIEALAARGGALAEESGLLEKVRSLRTGWQQAGALPRDSARALTDRFDQALGAIVAASPATFRHTELDIDGNRRQLELLCERVEKLVSREPVGAGAASPVATLATQLREALAANTIGGRVDEESRWKNSEYEVRGAQDAWRQVGFVPEAAAAPLTARFQRACQRFYGQRRPTSGPPSGAPRAGRPRT